MAKCFSGLLTRQGSFVRRAGTALGCAALLVVGWHSASLAGDKALPAVSGVTGQLRGTLAPDRPIPEKRTTAKERESQKRRPARLSRFGCEQSRPDTSLVP